MANYYGYARSNYFRVKDVERFKAAVGGLNVQVVFKDGEEIKADNNVVALLSDWEGGWNCYKECENGDMEEVCIEDVVSGHLLEDEVAVFLQNGHEKLVYLTGSALAVNSKGEKQHVDIADIYDKAKILGKNITRAED